MPAALRGDRRGAARGRAEAARKSGRAARAPAAPARPSKLRAARGARLSPKLALGMLGLILALGVAVVLATGGRGARLAADVREAGDSRFASLGLRVSEVRVRGATPAARADILRAARIPTGGPILDVDLGRARARIEALAWVRRARVTRLFPATILIDVDQQPLMARWRHAGRLAVVAEDGAVVANADPRAFGGLPLISGAGANTQARDILGLLRGHPRLTQRLSALVRVDERRWDAHLADGAVVQLPAEGEQEALARLDALEQSAGILELGLARIDLRDPDMVLVRPRNAPVPVAGVNGA